MLFFFPKAATPGVSLPHTRIAPLCFFLLVPGKPEQTGDSMYKDYTSVLWVTQVVPRRYVVLHLLGRVCRACASLTQPGSTGAGLQVPRRVRGEHRNSAGVVHTLPHAESP